ncbi:hypothetical protein CYMTET_14145, partial [Cymbomonas tetramitiformis]
MRTWLRRLQLGNNDTSGRAGSEGSTPSSGAGSSADEAHSTAAGSMRSTRAASHQSIASNIFGGSHNANNRTSSDAGIDYQNADIDYHNQLQLALALSQSERGGPHEDYDNEDWELQFAKEASLNTSGDGQRDAAAGNRANALAYLYWSSSCLDFADEVPDGFYDLGGSAFPEFDLNDRLPSLEQLRQLESCEMDTREVIVVDRATDQELNTLEESAVDTACGLGDPASRAQKLAQLVAEHFGGPTTCEASLLEKWRVTSAHLKAYSGGVTVQIGQLRCGLARHRALLFKVLAESVNVQCKLQRGMQRCGAEDKAHCVILCAGREFQMDLMQEPGKLCPVAAPSSWKMQATGTQEPFSPRASVTTAAPDEPSELCTPPQVTLEAFLSMGVQVSTCPAAIGSERLPSEPAAATKHLAIPRQGARGPAPLRLPPPRRANSSALQVEAEDGMGKVKSKQHRRTLSEPAQSLSPMSVDVACGPDHADQTRFMQWEVAQRQEEEGAPRLRASSEENTHAGDRLGSMSNSPPTRGRGLGSSSQWQIDDEMAWARLRVQVVKEENEETSAVEQQQQEDGISKGSAAVEQPPAGWAVGKPRGLLRAASADDCTSSSQAAAGLPPRRSSDNQHEAGSGGPQVPACSPETVAVLQGSEAVPSRSQEMRDSAEAGRNYSAAHASTQLEVWAQIHQHAAGEDGGGLAEEGAQGRGEEGGRERVLEVPEMERLQSLPYEWEIKYAELKVAERIGIGSYGEVYHGVWRGTEVAVKKFLDQDPGAGVLSEFNR